MRLEGDASYLGTMLGILHEEQTSDLWGAQKGGEVEKPLQTGQDHQQTSEVVLQREGSPPHLSHIDVVLPDQLPFLGLTTPIFQRGSFGALEATVREAGL